MTSLECSICLAGYQKPKLLSCLHVYCLECIRNFSQGGGTGPIKCPLCRQLTALPEEGVETLPDYTATSAEAGLEDGRDYCGFCCKDAVAEFRCNDCEDSLCLSCKDQHMRMKQTKNHVLGVLEEQTKTVKQNINPLVNCRFHCPFAVEYYCMRCSTVCCEMGLQRNHKNHPVKPLSEAAEEKRNVANAYIETAKGHFTSVVNEVCDVLVEQDNLKTFIDRKTVAIDTVADQLKRSIDGAAEDLKIRMTAVGETLNQRFQESLETSNNKAKSILSLIQSTGQIINEASNQDFLSFHEDVISHLMKEQAKLKVKEPRLTFFPTPEVKDALVNNIQEPTHVSSLLQPLFLNKVRRSFKVEGNEITAIACLTNGAIVVCQGNAKRLNVVGARGQDLGTFIVPFKIGSLAHITDGILVATESSGPTVATFRLWTDVIKIKNMHCFVQGVSFTRDRTCIVLCCSDTKFGNKKQSMNGHIVITNLSLEIQMQMNINTGGDIVKHAVQKSNGDFIAITTKTCVTMSSTGCVKSSFDFGGTVQGACADLRDNLIVVLDLNGSKIVTFYDPKLEGKKDLITLTENPNVNARCMIVDDQGDVWIGYDNNVQCVRYTL